MKTSSYVFGAAMALSGVMSMADQAMAASITAATFTFESIAAGATAATFGPIAAESGTGTVFASHASTATVYSTPVGSGSAKSLSANTYAPGDYFQFSVPTTGLQDLLVAFDAASSGTGPKVFSFAYSTTGSTGAFSAFSSYTLNTGTATAFGSSATNSALTYSFNLAGVTGLNNDANAVFRLIEADTTTAAGGTSRVDNFVVSGNTFVAGNIPEPASLALVSGVIGAIAVRRRRD